MVTSVPLKRRKQIAYQIQCKDCSVELDLGEFLRREEGKYYQIRTFLKKHQDHQLMLVGIKPTETLEAAQNYPYSHLDLSTPEKRHRWKMATQMLLRALVAAENNRKTSGNSQEQSTDQSEE